MIDRGKHNLLGVRIDAVDYEAAVERVVAAARDRRSLTASALAVHGVMTGALDSVHRRRLNAFDLLVPDGQPVRWGLNWLHRTRLADRVYGPTLMLRLCARLAEEGLPIFLFGSTAEVLRELEANLTRHFPGLKVAGTAPSKFRRLSPNEQDELAAQLRDSGARVTFVGLGCPRQETFAFELRAKVPMPLIAVGAAFAFHSGALEQAPPRLQKYGLEWLFRLLREPTRLWKRYLLLNPAYLFLLFLQSLGIHAGDPHPRVTWPEELRYG